MKPCQHKSALLNRFLQYLLTWSPSKINFECWLIFYINTLSKFFFKVICSSYIVVFSFVLLCVVLVSFLKNRFLKRFVNMTTLVCICDAWTITSSNYWCISLCAWKFIWNYRISNLISRTRMLSTCWLRQSKWMLLCR